MAKPSRGGVGGRPDQSCVRAAGREGAALTARQVARPRTTIAQKRKEGVSSGSALHPTGNCQWSAGAYGRRCGVLHPGSVASARLSTCQEWIIRAGGSAAWRYPLPPPCAPALPVSRCVPAGRNLSRGVAPGRPGSTAKGHVSRDPVRGGVTIDSAPRSSFEVSGGRAKPARKTRTRSRPQIGPFGAPAGAHARPVRASRKSFGRA